MKHAKYALFLFLLGLTLSGYAQDSEVNDEIDLEEKNPQIVHVVLLAGQSNMAGAGNYDSLSYEVRGQLEKVSNRVLLSFNGKPAQPLSWYTNKPTEKYNFTKRFGPELLIGLKLAEVYPTRNFLLIKRSHGGTALYGAWNPSWDANMAKAVEKETKQKLKLYKQHQEDIKLALDQITKEGKQFKVIGLAWMQGENDAAKEVSATTYKENLKALVQAYRTDQNTPQMPFILGQINSRYGRFKEGPAVVRQAMLDVAKSDQFVKVVETSTDLDWSDFPKHSDNVHYNYEGQRRLGIAFAKAMIELNKEK